MAEKITSAKMWRRDAMILLFTLAIMSTFAECPRELERLKDRILISNKFTIFKKIKIAKLLIIVKIFQCVTSLSILFT